MPPDVRRAIAFVAGRLISSRPASAIYDFSYPGYTYLTGTIGSSISIYDHGRRSHLTGSPTSFYDHATKGHVSLTLTGRSFTGYSFATAEHFQGTISQANVTLYDHMEHKHFHYLLV
jgi:hypothetical protein